MTGTSAPTLPWRGIFPIPVTPFLPDGALDLESLARQVEFCLESGARGIVYPGVVSEFFTLTEDERRTATEVVQGVVAGRVPFVVGVAATSTPVAAELAAHARGIGADGVMATLPYVNHFFAPDADYIAEYYTAIATSGGLPIILQNARIGQPIGFEGLRELLGTVPQVRYLKQETSPCTQELTGAMAAVGTEVDGIFGGLGSVYLINELDRGACGSMPSPAVVDLIVGCYDHYRNGNRAQARSGLSALAPLFTLELLYNVSVIKEVLHRRGILAHTACRAPVPYVDDVDRRELDEILPALGL